MKSPKRGAGCGKRPGTQCAFQGTGFMALVLFPPFFLAQGKLPVRLCLPVLPGAA